MLDSEKVIDSIERCVCNVNDACRDCVYYDIEHPYIKCVDILLRDALALLKAQESIIRCKDCKHYAVEDHYGNFHGYEILAASDIPTCHRWGNDACMVKPDGYCFLAESR